MTSVGKWADWYHGLEKPWPYGETTSYEIGAAWLAKCALTGDWVCGAGWFGRWFPSNGTGVSTELPLRCAAP